MKKLFYSLLAIALVLVPVKKDKVEAKSWNANGYYCDSKQDLGDGTFYQTCHILLTTDFDVNHVTGNIILKNVTLKDIKTTGDWKSENGLSTTVSFKSDTPHTGSFAVADFVVEGKTDVLECEASFEPGVPEKVTENLVCAMLDDKYYGKDGVEVTEEKYYEECCNYTCTVISNKFYLNSQGKSVSYDEFIKDCSEVTTTTTEVIDTGINYGYIVLPLGIISIFAIIKISKKNTKIYKI